MRTSRLWSLAGIFIVLALLIATGWALRRSDDEPSLPAAPATVEATQTPRPAASAVAPTPFRQPAPTVPPLVPFPENAVMIVFISWVVWYTGQIHSPLLNLYLLPIIASALIFGKLPTAIKVQIYFVAENNSRTAPAPVEFIVPIMVQALTNSVTTTTGGGG